MNSISRWWKAKFLLNGLLLSLQQGYSNATMLSPEIKRLKVGKNGFPVFTRRMHCNINFVFSPLPPIHIYWITFKLTLCISREIIPNRINHHPSILGIKTNRFHPQTHHPLIHKSNYSIFFHSKIIFPRFSFPLPHFIVLFLNSNRSSDRWKATKDQRQPHKQDWDDPIALRERFNLRPSISVCDEIRF